MSGISALLLCLRRRSAAVRVSGHVGVVVARRSIPVVRSPLVRRLFRLAALRAERIPVKARGQTRGLPPAAVTSGIWGRSTGSHGGKTPVVCSVVEVRHWGMGQFCIADSVWIRHILGCLSVIGHAGFSRYSVSYSGSPPSDIGGEPAS